MVRIVVSAERTSIVLGTRGSALALAQAELTEAALRAAHPDLTVERRIVRTTGDRRTDVPLSSVAKAEGRFDKGVFIKELELALERGEIDVAVHSLKDVPSTLDDGFEIAAVLPRAPAGDVLLTKAAGGLKALPPGATVATSSVRRQRMLQWLRADLHVADIRGNVPTRIRKLHETRDLDGIVLAEAGLRRLGLLEGGRVVSEESEFFAEVLDHATFLPAAGQGAIALEVRAADGEVRDLVQVVNHAETLDAVRAERRFLELLGAGCDTPVGVLGRVERAQLHLRALVFEDGEAAPLRGEVSGLRGGAMELAEALIRNLQRAET